MAKTPATDRRATLADVAAEAGVSVSTASGVLRDRKWCAVSDRTRQLVFNAAEKVGYRPNMLARSLRGEGTHTLGVVVSEFSLSLMTDARLQSIENAASKRGYRLIVGTHQFDRKRFEQLIDGMIASCVDGVIFWGISPGELDLVDRVRKVRAAVAAIDPHHDYDIAGINIDRAHGGREQIRHLVSIGRRRIAFLLTSHGGHTGGAKVVGIREAMAEAGLDMAASPVLEGACKDRNFAKLGRQMTQELIDRGDDFDALVALADNVALGAIAALVQSGRRVPQDVAVVGFDGEHVPEGQVIPLTTVHQPRNVGDAMFDALLPQLTKQPDASARRVILKPRLIVRESTVLGAGCGVWPVDERSD